MGINIATEQDIERLRMFSELQARDLTTIRRKMAMMAARLATAEGLDSQQVLEHLMLDIGADVNASSSSPLNSKSERWSGTDGHGQPKKTTQKTGHGPTKQPKLPTQEVLCELDEADRICPACGGELKAIDGLTEDTTEIDVVEVKYLVRTIKKQKYRCTCSNCQHLETALGPETPKPIQSGRYTLNFAIQVILDKFASHLPLARQSRRMKDYGLNVTSQTLWDYTHASAKWLLPTYDALRLEVLKQPVVGADETRWRLLKPKSKAKPQIIALTSDVGVWYGFEKDKKTETLDRLLGDFEGVLIADGLSIYTALHDQRSLAYERLETERKPFTLAQCWVHARRNYIKAVRGDPHVEEMLLLIGRLYRLKRAYSPELHDVWQTWTDAVLDGIRAWMLAQLPRPGSQLEQAIKYMNARWKALTLFRDQPEIWLDNNGTERALRLAIQGRKNHYGSHSERGMETCAVFYSLIESCSRLDINTRAYLHEALSRAIVNPGTVYTPSMHLAEHSD